VGGEPGGHGCGNIFFLKPPSASGGAWTETILYAFADTNDACNPEFGPTIGPDGALYGVTASGGVNGDGALYKLNPPASPGGAWTESILYNFNVSEIAYPVTPLVPGPDVSFYAANDSGVFQLQPPATSAGSWTAVWLQSNPNGPTSITPGPDGSLYVTTVFGGNGLHGKGQILQLFPPASPGGDWTQTVIYSLAATGQGGAPNSLAVIGDGTLYGTTYGSCCGDAAATLFKLTPPASSGGDWTYTMLNNFGSANQLDQPLILRRGKMFDAFVGSEDAVFALTPPSVSEGAWTVNFLHNFADQAPGFSIVGGSQVMDAGGTIYGATKVYVYEGPSPTGTVYRIVP
jgi:uncharacterized repeat protein (TIGR03803 family)